MTIQLMLSTALLLSNAAYGRQSLSAKLDSGDAATVNAVAAPRQRAVRVVFIHQTAFFNDQGTSLLRG